MKISLAFLGLGLAACPGNTTIIPDAIADGYVSTLKGIAVAGDYKPGDPGILSWFDVQTRTVHQNAAPEGAIGDDPVLRTSASELFIVNRADGDNVTVLDANTFAFVEQLGTGAGSNPQDVAVVGNKLYVPALGTTGVVVLTRGSTTTTTIDLGTPLGDPDGKPDCVSAYLSGTQLYVACGLLDSSFTPEGVGKIAVIDTTTDTYVSSFDLPFANPQGFFVRPAATSGFGGDMLIPLVPSFTDYTSGCIARVSGIAASCAITNADLAGFAAHLAVDGETLWTVVGTYDAMYTNPTGVARPYDMTTGIFGANLSSASELISDMTVCPDGTILGGDTKPGAAGVRVYSGGTEVTTAPLAIGLAPGTVANLACY